jgi:hypothetical protein
MDARVVLAVRAKIAHGFTVGAGIRGFREGVRDFFACMWAHEKRRASRLGRRASSLLPGGPTRIRTWNLSIMSRSR